MTPPLFLLFIPGSALVLLVQIIICKEIKHILNNRNQLLRPEKNSNSVQKQRNRSSKSKSKTSGKETSTEYPSSDDPAMSRAYSSKSKMQEPKDLLNNSVKSRGRSKTVFAESYNPYEEKNTMKRISFFQKTPEEIHWLKNTVKKLVLFQHLANDQIDTVVGAMYKLSTSPGEYICVEGDEGTKFFVIEEGIVDVVKRDDKGNAKLVLTYKNTGSFGELALLYNQPRAASVIARTEGILWVLDGDIFRHIVCQITHKKRLIYESLISRVPLLQSLKPQERANLVDALLPVTVNGGHVIFEQGDKADGMYLVLSGRVKIIMRSQGKHLLLKEVTSGDYFGELALITNKARAASAVADGQTDLAYLDRAGFERLLGPCMNLFKRNIKLYENKLREIIKDSHKYNG